MTIPSLTPLANHLWQSTLFAAAAGLLTLAFRRNHAPVRYSLWLAASLKFLVPFSLLVSLGSQVEWRPARAAAPQIYPMVEEIAQPFVSPAPGTPTSQPQANALPAILLGVWFCGFAASAWIWFRQWRRIRATIRAAEPSLLEAPIPVLSSPGRGEPGVFGIWKPVLLLPAGITERLTPAQLRAILVHELCHARRRDNLTAAMHMVVETLFWFHPLVWWIRLRLVDERERACDEEVLRVASEPEEYAEGLLNVCKFYLESPLVCMSGVTGSNLKRRIREIMTPGIVHQLNFGKKLLLGVAAAAAVAIPIAVGFINAPPIQAQAQPAASIRFEVASVKPNKSLDGRRGGFRDGWSGAPGDRLRVENVPLYDLITQAYDLPFQTMQLSGGPDWIRSERFDIDARLTAGVIPENASPKVRSEKMMAALQSLLADRFQLVLRHERKDIPIYVLLVGKNGPKLKKAAVEEKDCPTAQLELPCHVLNGGMGRGLHAKAASVADALGFAGNWSDRPMVDKTGIEGLFEFDTEGWTPMIQRNPDASPEEGLSDPTRATLFMVFDRLGLKLDPQKGPADIYVIESVSRPTGN